ncbi:hypothetical protein Q4511_03910 [Paracoccus sp. 1_MG-2023]|uniref:hypothetical protein n=1 Tax=unclassified Paracoccus (in: a-proteobacteria) TaxID=2688777 RepID=UPI001C091482|nr:MULTISPECIES: hypothetical protein [unclassified Paracoccus (in: a-proteobacteria)]MBU2956860.1 hypothetical protein [Paracoccus sp. C2R09]MDO6668058.1 hypothetical protein [Paracoccus sp. 1_MG-2023]
MANGSSEKAHNDLVLSFLAVRRAIGALGYFLPVILLLSAAFMPGGLRTSISSYYYSSMREVFVGTMFAQAVFLWSYEGFRPRAGELITDRRMARLAAISAALVGLAPTSGPAGDCTALQCILGPDLAAGVHFVAAALFFVALSVFCLVLFVRGDVNSPEKRASNRIYRICGWTILGCIGAIGAMAVTGLDDALAVLRPVFWLESIACFAFATSWAVKGDSLRPLVRNMVRGA